MAELHLKSWRFRAEREADWRRLETLLGKAEAGGAAKLKRDELLEGIDGIASESAPVYGQQLWNYYVRSYPDVVEAHFPGTV